MSESTATDAAKRARKGSSSSSNNSSSTKWRSNSSSTTSTSKSKRLERLERFSSEPNVSSWDRLDAVEDFGFVSKGDDRLKDLQNQERYHKHIANKYLEFCGSSGGVEQLETEFADLAITPLDNPHATAPAPALISRGSSNSSGGGGSGGKNAVYNDSRNAQLSGILLSMRKLREGITAARRTDKFAIEVFKQHIRAAILVQQIENYHSALTHLLHQLHPVTPLNNHDLQEFASYHMLHLAACLEEYGSALAVKHEFHITDRRAIQALSAMIHGNYWSWRAARNRVDQYLGRLMDYAEERMRRFMLKCVGVTYFTVEQSFLEMASGQTWKRLQNQYSVGWEVDASTKVVTVRKPKMRSKPQPMQQVLDKDFRAWD